MTGGMAHFCEKIKYIFPLAAPFPFVPLPWQVEVHERLRSESFSRCKQTLTSHPHYWTDGQPWMACLLFHGSPYAPVQGSHRDLNQARLSIDLPQTLYKWPTRTRRLIRLHFASFQAYACSPPLPQEPADHFSATPRFASKPLARALLL